MDTLTAKLGSGKLVSRSRIQRLADEIALKFHPSRVILFGSYACGEATIDSDVDIFVLLRTGTRGVDSLRIRRETFHDFALDILVMSEKKFRERIREGDFFLADIQEHGVVLYEEKHS